MNKVPLRQLNEQLQKLLEEDQDYEAGFALGRHILRYWPHCLQTYVHMGLAALTVGLYADATDILQRALSVDPEAGVLWAAYRQAAAAMGLDEAVAVAQAYEQDLLLPAKGIDRGMIGEAQAAIEQGHWPQALRAYQRLHNSQPQRMDIALGHAFSLFQLERYEACVAVCQRILEELPNSLKAHWLMVRCAYASTIGHIDAYAHLKRIDTIDPDYDYARRWFPDLEPPSDPALCPAWNPEDRWELA